MQAHWEALSQSTGLQIRILTLHQSHPSTIHRDNQAHRPHLHTNIYTCTFVFVYVHTCRHTWTFPVWMVVKAINSQILNLTCLKATCTFLPPHSPFPYPILQKKGLLPTTQDLHRVLSSQGTIQNIRVHIEFFH